MSMQPPYDPGQIVLIFGGIVTGYAKGTMVEVSRAEESWKTYVGTQGEVSRVRNRNITGTIKVTLMQVSPTRAIFDAMIALDEQTGSVVLPVLVRDLTGTEMAVGQEAWLLKPADKGYGDDMGTREYTIAVAELVMQ